jgi:hypothetical protein
MNHLTFLDDISFFHDFAHGTTSLKNSISFLLNLPKSRLTPVILATQEAEIRRIKFQSQLGQVVQETLSQNYPT